MTQSAYSWMGTRIHLVLDDDVAALYNQAQDCFLEAQINHRKVHGSKWNPDQPLEIAAPKGAFEAWNQIASIINLISKVNGGTLDIPGSEVTSNYLIKL